jgi:acyl-homoserine lactone acylase PvdQ
MMRFRLVPALAALVLTAVTAHGAAVTVRDPAFGLPHFYADTDLELARENGRQIARDRLVQMILLGRTGRGTIYQPFGILDAGTLQDDIEARRTAYTSSELYQMFDKLPAAGRAPLLE